MLCLHALLFEFDRGDRIDDSTHFLGGWKWISILVDRNFFAFVLFISVLFAITAFLSSKLVGVIHGLIILLVLVVHERLLRFKTNVTTIALENLLLALEECLLRLVRALRKIRLHRSTHRNIDATGA